DWHGPVNINSGASASIPHGTATADCSNDHCTVSLQQSQSVSHNGGSLEAAGAALPQDDDSTLGRVAAPAKSSEYLNARKTTGAYMAGCSKRVTEQAKAVGIVVDCEGTERTDLDFDGMECGKRCVSRTETHETTNEQCTSTVPISGQKCITTFGKHYCIEQT